MERRYLHYRQYVHLPGIIPGGKNMALKVPELYNGTLISQTVFDNSTPAWTILPANAKGSTPPPDSPCLLITSDANEWGTGHSDKLVVWEYDVDWDTPGNTTWSVLAQLPVTAYTLTGNQVPQRVLQRLSMPFTAVPCSRPFTGSLMVFPPYI